MRARQARPGQDKRGSSLCNFDGGNTASQYWSSCGGDQEIRRDRRLDHKAILTKESHTSDTIIMHSIPSVTRTLSTALKLKHDLRKLQH